MSDWPYTRMQSNSGVSEPTTEAWAWALLNLCENRQMPDHATPRVTLGEIRAAVAEARTERQRFYSDLVAEAHDCGRKEALRELRDEVGHKLGHDLRELATDAEGALHCIWPTMFLRVLDAIGWEDGKQ